MCRLVYGKGQKLKIWILFWPWSKCIHSNRKGIMEKVYFRSQILERPSIGEYWNISSVPVLPENVIFTFFKTCRCYSEAYNTGTQKWSSIVQYSRTSIWDLKYTFSGIIIKLLLSLLLLKIGHYLGLQTIWPCFKSKMAVFGRKMVIFHIWLLRGTQFSIKCLCCSFIMEYILTTAEIKFRFSFFWPSYR